MMNLDKLSQRKTELQNQLADALRANDSTAAAEAMQAWSTFISDQIMAEASGAIEAADRNILAARGIRQLTSKETEYYNKVIESARQEGVVTNIIERLPETVIDAVLDDIQQDHPLLAALDFQNTGAAIKFVINAQGAQQATWDELNTEISTKLSGAIEVLDMTFCKLTAYMFCTKDMLALGPKWLDAYVRSVLGEAVATSLEVGSVDGNGVKKFIGMTRDFAGSYSQTEGYARKQAIAVTDFGAATYGSLLAKLAVDRNGNPRTISKALLLCNPADYFSKIMPATTVMTPQGTYVGEVLPYPTDIIQSVGVPAGYAVLGIDKKYFAGIGTAKGGKLEYDDSYKFLEDLRTYVIRFYGNGRPMDINCFLLLDISNLKPVMMTVKTITDASAD